MSADSCAAIGEIVTWRPSSTDITRVAQKIFANHNGDLMRLPESRGVYFVPQAHVEITGMVERTVSDLGGDLRRFPVSSDCGGQSDQSVAATVKDHMESLIKDFRQTCESLSEKSPEYVRSRQHDSLRDLRWKLQAYRALLGGFREDIERSINEADKFMNERICRKPAEQELSRKPATVASPEIDPVLAGLLAAAG